VKIVKYSISSSSSGLRSLIVSLVASAATACGAEYTEDAPPNTPAARSGAVQTPSGPVGEGGEEADPRPIYTPSAPSGQWVYTEGYGWVWMPYEQAYTYVSPAEDDAYAYVYYPASGWQWIHAPWVLGVGPRPYWGPLGPVRFGWYAHPWFHPRRVYYYHRPYYHRAYRGYRR
jgi:hypothetical protein